jgi:hypothetical protein
MTTLRHCTWVAALAVLPSLASAQVQTPVTQQAPQPPAQPTVGPPIQRIETASALSKEPLGTITSVAELPDGRVLVNDGTRRRLLLMDTTLANAEVVLDSMSEIMNTYGPRPGALLPYPGDSVMFIDPASYAVVVIGPDGKPGRVRSVWRVEHAPYFTSSTGTYGWPGIDAKGRVIYRIPARPNSIIMSSMVNGVPYIPPQPDSALIVAVDLNSRKVDTLASVRVAVSQMRPFQTAEGYTSFISTNNPLPVADSWAVLPDGTIAIVRALDYRIDYINPDGTRTSSEKLPYEWVRMTDEDKTRMVDSVRTVLLRSANSNFATQLIAWANASGRDYPANFKVPEGYTLPPGLPRGALLPEGVTFPANYVYACPRGAEPPPGSSPLMIMAGMPPTPPPPGAPGTPAAPSCAPSLPDMYYGGNMPTTPPSMRPVFVAEPDELPDYRPPMPPTAAARADMDGNLWIRTMPLRPGGVVYDIVDRSGKLANRIQLPSGYTLVGFGRGKVVYLSMRDAQGIHLARVRLR